MLTGFIGYAGALLDFKNAVKMEKAYVVASSFRSGSTNLCVNLWETGVMGAPWEYYNFDNDKRFMYARLAAQSPGDYLRKLIGVRTSSNGVFGLKAHFRHFDVALREYPPLLEMLRNVQFIYINRQDKVAQAVSMARALQTNAWIAFQHVEDHPPLFYQKEFIDQCLAEVKLQTESWAAWFRKHNVTPMVVHHEELIQDLDATLQKIMDHMSVKPDPAKRVELVKSLKQSDKTNSDWNKQYREDLGFAAGHKFGWDLMS